MTAHDVMALPRRRAWPALLLLALVVALALQLYFERGRRQLAAAVAASAGASAAAASPSVSSPGLASAPAAASAAEPQWGQAGEAAARVARAASAALATARAAAGLAPAAPVDTELALCGVGRLSLPHPLPPHSAETPRIQAAWEALPPALAEPARRQAWRRVQSALAAPGQPERARAAAWMLLVMGTAEPADAVAAGSAQAQGTAAVSAARSLARLARGSRDTTVLRWALAACSRESQASAECRRLSAQDLTRLSPDDGLHWLQWAGTAGATTAAADRLREQALDRASRAQRFGPTQGALALLVDTAWPDDLPGYLRLHLLRQALALDAELMQPVLEAATAQCTAERMEASGRREACDRLARNLLVRAQDGALLDVAAVLAARLAWPEADMQPLKAEEAALLQATASLVPTDQPYACPVLDDTRNWVMSVATDGELQAARRRLAMNPTTARPAASKP